MHNLYDITIIGGGPVGLFTAFYAHLRKAKVKIIDSLHQLGGQPAILYPEKNILDIPAYPSIDGQTLTNQLIKQLGQFHTRIHLNETVLSIHKQEHFVIETSKGLHLSKSIIIAMGGGAFKPRTLDLDGIDNFQNIHYFVNNMQQYTGTNVVVLGGGDSAVDWSLAFEPFANTTTIVHRRPSFRAMENSVHLLQQSTVNIKTPFLPTKLIGEKNQLTHLEITEVKTQNKELLPVDHLFINYGFNTSIGTLKEWGLTLNKHKIVVDSKQQSSIEGIFAVGDCCYYDGKIDVIASGFGEAPTAVNNAMTFIDPTQRTQPMHSTSLDIE